MTTPVSIAMPKSAIYPTATANWDAGIKRESEAEKRFDEILRRMSNAKRLSRAEISQDSCPKRVQEVVNLNAIFGYKFGYRHQFALITANSAKLRSRLDLGKSQLRSITPIYHRLTVFMGNSKSVGSNSMGVRFPLPAPTKMPISSVES